MRILLSMAFLLMYGGIFCQGLNIADSASPIRSVELIEMPEQDNGSLMEKVKRESPEGAPKVFATPLFTSIECSKRGKWEPLRGDRMLWRTRIRSAGAFSLNLGFQNFELPPSAAMFIYDLEKSYVVGPVTAKDNDKHREWWSPLLPFDEIVIEVQVDEDEINDLNFEIQRVNHDFSGLGLLLSGSCNVDVACSEQEGFGFIDQYRDIVQSVGAMTISGNVLCSGYLVNTVRNDCTPYFMSAFHCNVTDASAPSVVVYWNYENSFCRIPGSQASGGAGDGNQQQFNSGATNVAGDDSLDFLLLLLDDEVDPNNNPFYAGWNAMDEEFDTTYCIHHPDGQEKRISADFDLPTFFADEVFIRIQSWDLGTTEGGSSGSPLFSKNKRVIGMLSGGVAACGNSGFDDFSSMKLAWNGIAGSPETRLKDWLDPDNTGARVLDGRFCAQIIGADQTTFRLCEQERLSDTVLVQIVSGFESGANISIVDPAAGISFTISSELLLPGETAEVAFSLDQEFEGDFGRFTIQAMNDESVHFVDINIKLTANEPGIPVLLTPGNNSVLSEPSTRLSWMGGGESYKVELSTDTAFVAERSFNTVDTFLIVSSLNLGQEYFWRVQAQNDCGQSLFSPYQSFSILEVTCEIFSSIHLPIIIPETPDIIEASIIVPEIEGVITDLDVLNILGRHSWVSDLSMSLTSPAGTTVRLVEYPCNDDDDFLVTFDDESNLEAILCPFNQGAIQRSEQLLSAFDGESPSGEWILQIDDDFNADGGSLISWGIAMCLDQSTTRSLTFTPDELSLCAKDTGDLSIEVRLSPGFQLPVTFNIEDKDGNPVGAIVDPSSGSGAAVVTISFVNTELVKDLSSLVVITNDQMQVDTFELSVIKVPGPSLPILVSPTNLASEVERSATFEWEVNDDVDRSRLIVYTDSNMQTVVLDTIVKETSFILDFRLKKNTTYYWQVESQGECANSPTDLFSFTTELSTATDNLIEESILIYPNPANDVVFVELRKSDKATILIRTILGQEMIKTSIDQGDVSIDVSTLQSGIYLAEISLAGKTFVKKLLVAH